jgi:hypothetical protein
MIFFGVSGPCMIGKIKSLDIETYLYTVRYAIIPYKLSLSIDFEVHLQMDWRKLLCDDGLMYWQEPPAREREPSATG